MKQLYLVRHAKSSWENHLLADIDRPLSTKGKRDAPIIGNILKEKKIMPDIIISSNAKRAFTTAKIIAEKLGYSHKIEVNKSIYEATTQNLLDVITSIDDKFNSAMIFGHNPGLTVLTGFITNEFVNNMPTSAVAIIELSVNFWKDVNTASGKLIGFEFPKKYSVGNRH
jgi:phosphohistidine phosphatase